ncbi:YciI family protein [Alteromonas oceanisediminis]|uniref:YciI family protein n=1 Tax=Alteromonas oceanisediminis TaxID=2836180 RepID=UPI001BD94C45|nr:YciI family protein [Alteromonas oceanisediminis]MBT0586939.1 hypothetical protein [Alteromonas oceanisediminis]
MNDFILLYLGGDPDWAENSSADEMQAAMGEWEAWMNKLSEQGKLVSGGDPLHYAGKRVTADGVTTDIAASELKELVSGYSIIKAATLDEAVDIAKTCPIMNYPDIVVEVREVLKMD